MPRASVVAALVALALPPLSLRADDDKSAQAKNPPSAPELKAKSTKIEVPAVSRDRLKEILRDALKQIQATEEAAAKSKGDLDAFTLAGMSKKIQAQTVAAIGRAQAKLGDLVGARSTWQIALDSAGEINSFNGPTEHSALYIEIAKAQSEAGEQNEARFTLRQALQAARSIKAESRLPFDVPNGMEFDSDPLAKKTELLRRIAEIQAQAGEVPASHETLRLAVETADSLNSPLNKVRALLEIAQASSSEKGKAVWAKTLGFAFSLPEEYPRAKAVEMVIRALLKANPADETLSLIADRFQGDLQHYVLWIAADEIANSDKPFSGKAMDRLCQLAQKAQFDRPSKKTKVFKRIAEAQARLGDYDGAYRTAGEPHPVNDIQTFRATQARAYVMKAIAEAQLKAKHRDAARDTVLTALEMFAPLPEEDAEAYFPLTDLCLLQVKVGDLPGALQTLGAVSSSLWKVYILAEIAVGHAQAGRPDDARKTIRMAFDASRRAPNDALWAASSESSSTPSVTQGIDPMHYVLQVLANAQARIGDLDAALKTLEDIKGSGYIDGYTRNQTIAQIVGTRLEAGDLAGARRVAELLPDDKNPFMTEKSSLLERVAKQQAQKEDPAGALAWAEKQNTPGSRLHILRGLADGIVERVAPQEAKAADSIPKPGTPN